MRILLTSHGSTGDIYPVIAYGKALRMAGHQVSFASAPLYREEIESAGLNFIHVPPDWRQEIFTEFMRELDRAKFPLLQLREIYRGALPFLGELIDRVATALKDHDILVSSYLFPHYKVIADLQNKPFTRRPAETQAGQIHIIPQSAAHRLKVIESSPEAHSALKLLIPKPDVRYLRFLP